MLLGEKVRDFGPLKRKRKKKKKKKKPRYQAAPTFEFNAQRKTLYIVTWCVVLVYGEMKQPFGVQAATAAEN